MNLQDITIEELNILEEITKEVENFDIKKINDDTNFWMIRTKGGYFFNEFITKQFIALAWNSIDKNTNFDENEREKLSDSIIMNYEEIKMPTTVINKCNTFINEVKENDIVVIPNKGSEQVVFALAGGYYEDDTKTVELEKKVIKRIEDKDVEINDVSCPYKKRRHITILRVLKGEDIDFKLYKAILNHHGISNLEAYERNILSSIYDVYIFKDSINAVFNVRKADGISPRALSGLLFGFTEYMCMLGIEEKKITTKVNINSPGPIDFNIQDIGNILTNVSAYAIILSFVIGGIRLKGIELPGVVDAIQKILKIKTEHDMDKAKVDEIYLKNENQKLINDKQDIENKGKKVELYKTVDKFIKESEIDELDMNKVVTFLKMIEDSSNRLEVTSVENYEIRIQQQDENEDE